MRYFDQYYRFLGDIFTSQHRLENVICELRTNRLDTNSMEVKLLPTDKSLFLVLAMMKEKEFIKINSKNYFTNIYLECNFGEFQLSSGQGQYINLKVIRFEKTDEKKNKANKNISIQKIHLTFYIPASSLFARNRPFTDHYTKGLLSGRIEKRVNHKMKEEWLEERYCFKTKVGFLEIVPSFLFGEMNVEENDQRGKFLIDQIIIVASLKLRKGLNLKLIENIIIEVDNFLRVISFLEGEFIQWGHLEISAKNKNSRVYEKVITRWITPLKNSYKNHVYYQKCKKEYLGLIPKLFAGYSILGNEIKREIDIIIDRFLISSTQEKLDSQIIYWHSCLDILLKYFVGSGKSFTHKFIDVCSKNNIEWEDLFKYLTDVSLREGKEMELNKIRNKIIHHGIYPRDYDSIMVELTKVKAICERLICKSLGFDYRKSCIGKLQE